MKLKKIEYIHGGALKIMEDTINNLIDAYTTLEERVKELEPKEEYCECINPMQWSRNEGELWICYKCRKFINDNVKLKISKSSLDSLAICIWRDEDWHGTKEGAKRVVQMILTLLEDNE